MDLRTMFSDSNDVASYSSGVFCATIPNNNSTAETHYSTAPELNPQPPPPPPSDITSLRLLSENLSSIFDASSSSSEHESYADARIVMADGREVAVHRCILAARSGFFRSVFKEKSSGEKVRMKEVAKEYEVGVEAVCTVLGYLYSGRVMPLPRGGVCVCVDDDCSHLGCRPAVDFMVQVLYASSTFLISELAGLCQRHLLDILDKVAIDDILVILSVANICGKICEGLLSRCTEILVKSDVDITTLEKSLPQPIVKRIVDKRAELGFGRPESLSFLDKNVKRIHRALDSDDVELVRMLLKEGHTNLDEACALHYAVAYCDAKTTTELLDLGLADVNHKNLRGYSVLHVAAMRKEPKIIVSLLTKGAQPTDLTLDGRKALQISKRLTKAADYYKSTEEGMVSSTDRLCIEILEQAERREPLLGEASLSLAMAGDDLRMKMLYLENRVGLAKVLFPMEAKVVMDIAQVDGTSEFQSEDIYPTRLHGRKTTTVDLNEAPFKMKEEHLVRMRALTRSVEIGKRFFPRCSEVLNKIMDADDLTQLACMGNDSLEERVAKRRRYVELQEILSKAFNEDKEEFDRSAMSSSSSSTSAGVVRPNNGKQAMKN